MTFQELCADLFRDFAGEVDWHRLDPKDQRLLAAAYLRWKPEYCEELLARVRPESIAENIATLIEHRDEDKSLSECDVFDLARQIRTTAWPDEALALDVEAELAHQWRHHARERHIAGGERMADAEREGDAWPGLAQRQVG